MRLFPRGDCAEKCLARTSILPSWRWAKCLLTRADFSLWRRDVEFVASLYNVFLRRDQVGAVEAAIKGSRFSSANLADIQQITAKDLVAQALSSGDVNSVLQTCTPVAELLENWTNEMRRPGHPTHSAISVIRSAEIKPLPSVFGLPSHPLKSSRTSIISGRNSIVRLTSS